MKSEKVFRDELAVALNQCFDWAVTQPLSVVKESVLAIDAVDKFLLPLIRVRVAEARLEAVKTIAESNCGLCQEGIKVFRCEEPDAWVHESSGRYANTGVPICDVQAEQDAIEELAAALLAEMEKGATDG